MGPLFFPPLVLKLKDFDFNLKKVKRVYFQFYFDTIGGNNRFRLRAYAVGKKRKVEEGYPPIELEVDNENSQDEQNKYFFPQASPELVLGQLELSNVQIKELLKDSSSGFLRFTAREMKINPNCIVYDITNGVVTRTANPCPPAPPPASDDESAA